MITINKCCILYWNFFKKNYRRGIFIKCLFIYSSIHTIVWILPWFITSSRQVLMMHVCVTIPWKVICIWTLSFQWVMAFYRTFYRALLKVLVIFPHAFSWMYFLQRFSEKLQNYSKINIARKLFKYKFEFNFLKLILILRQEISFMETVER